MESVHAHASEEQTLRLERRVDGRLVAHRGAAASPVRPVRCFPWSQPGTWISLRDDDGLEVALVVDPVALDPASRAALELELAELGMVLQIERIVAVEEELEIRTWRVETREGPRRFQTARDEWPRPIRGGGLLLRDVAGDLYLVPHTAELDRTSQRALWAFTDSEHL